MVLDFTVEGEVKINMTDYVKGMIEDFPEELSSMRVTSAAMENLFKVNEKVRKLSQERAEQFHTMVAKALFVAKQA